MPAGACRGRQCCQGRCVLVLLGDCCCTEPGRRRLAKSGACHNSAYTGAAVGARHNSARALAVCCGAHHNSARTVAASGARHSSARTPAAEGGACHTRARDAEGCAATPTAAKVVHAAMTPSAPSKPRLPSN
eukprot:524954-Alexandrium_andersonii.AAC.1